jgi:hypothetical protein
MQQQPFHLFDRFGLHFQLGGLLGHISVLLAAARAAGHILFDLVSFAVVVWFVVAIPLFAIRTLEIISILAVMTRQM